MTREVDVASGTSAARKEDMTMLRLKADPLPIFREADSPVALHVRQRWLGDDARASDLAGETVARIEAAQGADGSWDGSCARTIENLFSLWLLLERKDPCVQKALDWLMETGRPPLHLPQENGATYNNLFFRTSRRDNTDLQRLTDVPFTPGCSGFVKTGAALFLATQFGLAGDDRVEKAFRSAVQTAKARNGRLCRGSCGNNINLALAVHPRHSRGPGMGCVLSWLERHMAPTGSWDQGIPFFPTLWVLAHLRSPKAGRLFRRALVRVARSQNSDGSWGRRQKLLDSFLVLDSLKRKGIEYHAA
jgi:hypothetical protein